MNRELRVAQLIYARVESAYSPERKSGFQTVCRSPVLTTADASAIEQRVQCFQQQVDIIRRQFFRLESGSIVLTHTKLLTTPDTTIIDSSGRTGAFIAHCLILTAAQFAEINDNPFAIFERHVFLVNPQQMIDHIQATAADSYHTYVRAGPDRSTASMWPIAEARKLVALALQGEELIKKGQSLLMTGEQDDILVALRTTFALTPKAIRSACSFDTCIDRCSTRPGMYWAVGATSGQSGNFILINPAQRRIDTVAAESLASTDPYLAWLSTADSQGITDDRLMARAAAIQDLARAFNERSKLNQDVLDEVAYTEFFDISRSRVTQNLKAALKKWGDTPLSGALIDFLYEIVRPNEIGTLLEMAACQQIDGATLSDCVVEWVDAKRPILKESEWKDILAILERAGAIAKMDHLEGYILTLDDAELSALEKSVKKRTDLPVRCRQAIQQRREAIGSKPGILGLFKRR